MQWTVEVRVASRSRARPGPVLVAYQSSPSFPTLTIGDAVFVDGQRFRLVARELHVEDARSTIIYLVEPFVGRSRPALEPVR